MSKDSCCSGKLKWVPVVLALFLGRSKMLCPKKIGPIGPS